MTLEPRSTTTTTTSKDERPIGDIINDAWQHAEILIRQELQLALAEAQERVDLLKVELEAKARGLQRDLIAKAIGGAVAFVALGVLMAALVLVLAEVMAPWKAALLVGGALAIAGFALLRTDMLSLQRAHETPGASPHANPNQ